MRMRAWVFLASSLLGSASRGAAVDFVFAPAHPTGLAPYSAALADMDGDSDLDAITVDLQDQEVGTVSVSRNDGSGGFSAPVSYPVGAGSAWLAVGDLNHDARPDVVVSNSQAEDSAAVTVYMNSGTGTLVSPHSLTAPPATYPHGIAIGDWNNDSHADVAVALMMAGEVKVFWGNGTGNFPTSVSVGTGFAPHDLAAGQFDAGTNLDLVVTDGNGAKVLYGTGTSFTAGPYVDNFPSNCDHVVTGDFDNDGHPDFATTGQALTLFLNDGTGHGWSALFFPVGENAVGVAAADFDGDTNLDIAAAVYLGNAVSVYYGDGSGGFPVRQDWGVGLAPNDLAIGDLDGDSRTDILAPSSQLSQTNFQVVRNLGGRTFHARRDFDVIGNANGFAVADFDRDGNPDVLVAVYQSNNDNLKLILGGANGVMEDPVLVESFGNNEPTHVIAADFNEDGWMDAAASIFSPGNDMRVWLNDGQGALLPSVTYDAMGNPASLAAGDLNGDTHLDAIVVNSAITENTISILIGVGDGTFLPQYTLPTLLAPSDVALADFDRDGDLDVLVTHLGDTSILLFVNDGVGGLSSAALNVGAVQRTPSVADLDADGWPDVALTTGVASVLINNHAGGFAFQAGTTNASGGVGLADFDQDGDADIVATTFFGSLASVLLNDGAGLFTVDAVVPVGYEAFRCAGADFDGDGWPEIVTANVRAGSISIVTNASLTVIFSDGFEVGDTSAWSIAVP